MVEKEKCEKLNKLALAYYTRQDVRKAIFEFSKQREVVPRYLEGFGKRPDMLHYEGDVIQFVKKGATSFHCSEELWRDPLALNTELSREQLDEMREGWDLLIDIDSKYLDYSKIAAQLIIEALKFHGIENFGIKFSGSKGFHIIVPWQAFPERVHDKETRKMFPEWPRAICAYLNEIIRQDLVEQITELISEERKSYVKDFDAAKQVMPDIQLVSSRHLFRSPYSLHEKTMLASTVLREQELKRFEPRDADPLGVTVRDFLPNADKDEAKELLVQALDWQKSKQQETRLSRPTAMPKIEAKQLTPEVYPPCIRKILSGLEDGRKRALFILLNFFRMLDLGEDEIIERVEEWNKRNKQPLKQGYVNSQLKWHFKQKKLMPPNCDKSIYKDILVCEPDELCKLIKNPLNYTTKKLRFSMRARKAKKSKNEDKNKEQR